MTRTTTGNLRLLIQILALCIGLGLGIVGAKAQTDTEPPPTLIISSTDTGSPPTIGLNVYGLTGAGEKLDLAATDLVVERDGTVVENVRLGGAHQAGTFTLFLIDVPGGVSGQMADIETAVAQYASDPTMMEQVDALAIYQVGTEEAEQLLEPTEFHNAVRNLFATPIEPADGPTALIDSTVGLLEQIEELKPNPDMVPFMVLITDGTDAVSTAFQPADVAVRAAQLGIPVHTIWLENDNLAPASQQFGRDYLAGVAADSRGLTTSLDNSNGLTAIWNRIASFRNQNKVVYTVDGLSGGEFTVAISLADTPAVRAETTVTLPNNLPVVNMELPDESRTLSLPNLEEPVTLRLGSNVGWLDGESRNIVAAQLLVNDTVVQDIPVDSLERFEATIPNFAYGNNTVQVAVLDNQGLRATSPPLTLTVNEGPQDIPEALAPGGSFLRLLGWTVLILLFLGLVTVFLFLAWRNGWLTRLPDLLPRGPSSRRGRPVPPVDQSVAAETGDAYARAFLEVMESSSRVAAQIPLRRPEERIGRSPAQTTVTFPEDVTVSRLHASLMLEGDNYRIYDEHSTSGTWVNDQKVPEYGMQLVDGDEIHLGAVHLRFRQP